MATSISGTSSPVEPQFTTLRSRLSLHSDLIQHRLDHVDGDKSTCADPNQPAACVADRTGARRHRMEVFYNEVVPVSHSSIATVLRIATASPSTPGLICCRSDLLSAVPSARDQTCTLLDLL